MLSSLRLTSAASLLVSRNASALFAARSLSSASLSKEDINRYLTTPPYILPDTKKIKAPPMVYIGGEEMTHYTMNLM